MFCCSAALLRALRIFESLPIRVVYGDWERLLIAAASCAVSSDSSSVVEYVEVSLACLTAQHTTGCSSSSTYSSTAYCCLSITIYLLLLAAVATAAAAHTHSKTKNCLHFFSLLPCSWRKSKNQRRKKEILFYTGYEETWNVWICLLFFFVVFLWFWRFETFVFSHGE